ncbi:MAG: 23S rRNA (adenine(2503)-C(2))-methyltransferase RlmN [Desulfovibrionaceae bacterium]|nr:23S rRNA (adenine(2503)-C(2))-methyltransferase RlmN [Desulfovibrionaceae bacterium]
MQNLLDLTLPELSLWVEKELGQPRFRAKQIWEWLWRKMARQFSEMTNISLATRKLLEEKACILWPKVVTHQTSQDQTTKFLLELDDGARIETVLIPSVDHAGKVRWSQCLSSQAGCPMACTFCATGQMGLTRNLTMAEITGQLLVARNFLHDTRPDHPLIRNLVFMGMGEPLLNLKNLLRALETFNDPQGLAFSPRRLTVSTCGIEEGLLEFGRSGLAYLAVSLHAPNQALRAKLMPKAARLPLERLLAILKAYPLKTRETITLEYLLIKGINDNPEQAHALAKIVQKLNGKLNLIAYNPTPNSPYQAPEPERVLAFEQILWQHHVTAILRQSKGQDIAAACGQLKANFALQKLRCAPES